MKHFFGLCFNWGVFFVSAISLKFTAHPTYEALFWILIKLEHLAWNFIPNALHTQLMKQCYGFCFNWIVFYIILGQMQCIPNLWIAVLDFNHSGGFMMFLLTIWSTHTQFMKRCYGFCLNWSVFYVIWKEMHCTPNLWSAVFGFQSKQRVYDVSNNHIKYTHSIYEVLFWILLQLDRFLLF